MSFFLPSGIITVSNATLPAANQAAPAVVPAAPAAPAAAPITVQGAQHAAPAAANLAASAKATVLSWSGYFEALAILFLALAVLWALLWLIRKRSGGILTGSSLALRIENRLPLGGKKWLLVARFLDKRLVLGVTDHQITLLSELEVDETPATPPKDSTLFAALLKKNKSGGQEPDAG